MRWRGAELHRVGIEAELAARGLGHGGQRGGRGVEAGVPVPADGAAVPGQLALQVGVGKRGELCVFRGEPVGPGREVRLRETPAPPVADAAVREGIEPLVQGRGHREARALDLRGGRHGQSW